MVTLRKKVEPKWLHPGAVLENGVTLEVGAVFFPYFKIMFREKRLHPLSRFGSPFFSVQIWLLATTTFLYRIKFLLYVLYQYVQTEDKKQTWKSFQV